MTSNRRLAHAAEVLRDRLKARGITVFDSLTDKRAADSFRVSEHALLIGSERYGEGLDIPGQALSLVIVEKINEAMTRSPLAEARKAKTKFGLYDYDFPLRMMWLKQRVGRLIRSPSDTGCVVVFDPRYHTWSAGSRIHVQKALAPMPIAGGTTEEILVQMEKFFTVKGLLNSNLTQ
jgi:ATP-dependent DNA helicase DinG